jgi:predicted component of type VI protein secretion system
MKKTTKLFTVLAFFIFIISACSTKEKEEEALDMEQVKIEIQALEDAYAAGEKAKDAAAVANYYRENAVSYSRNKEPIKGKAAIQELQAIPPEITMSTKL